MDTRLNPVFKTLYRVLGSNADCRIEIGADATIIVRIGKQATVVPLEVAVALQSQDARDYLADKTIAAFLYSAKERLDKQRAAWDITRAEIVDKRRDFKRRAMEAGFSEVDATYYAALKFP